MISYRWMFNGSDIITDPGHIYNPDGPVLIIINVTIMDGGEYNCIVNYTNIIATSDQAFLYGKILW